MSSAEPSNRRAAPASGASTTYIALGGNVGDVLATFRQAIELMKARGVHVDAVAKAYRTVAMLPPGQTGPADDFWNTACRATTRLNPEALLAVLLGLERQAGRDRDGRWSPRPLDLDILLYDNRVQRNPGLTIPHPGLTERIFVLLPLCDIAPDLAIPSTGSTVTETLHAKPDPRAGVLEVRDAWL